MNSQVTNAKKKKEKQMCEKCILKVLDIGVMIMFRKGNGRESVLTGGCTGPLTSEYRCQSLLG